MSYEDNNATNLRRVAEALEEMNKLLVRLVPRLDEKAPAAANAVRETHRR